MPEFVGIDLFAGAGGMSLGAINAGIEIELAVESDPHAAKTYSVNHPDTTVFQKDIRELSASRIKRIKKSGRQSIVFGGPPCQGFSFSNLRTRSVENDDNWLFEEFLRVVSVWKPDWVVFENVRGIANTANGLFVGRVAEQLDQLGFNTTHGLLNAMHYGVPQDRARFFMVAAKKPIQPKLPSKTRRKTPTVNDAIYDLPKLKNGASESTLEYSTSKKSSYVRRMRNGQTECNNNLVSRNSEYVIKRYAHVPQGGNWEDIPEKLMKNYTDRSRCHTGIYRRLDPNKPSVVIGNYRKNMLIHPDQDRGLSVREAARIQSFPDDYVFQGSIGFQQQQVGNAVPPLLAQAVFKSIVAQSSGDASEDKVKF